MVSGVRDAGARLEPVYGFAHLPTLPWPSVLAVGGYREIGKGFPGNFGGYFTGRAVLWASARFYIGLIVAGRTERREDAADRLAYLGVAVDEIAIDHQGANCVRRHAF